MVNEFEAVRNWSGIRGIGGADAQVQYQRVLQEVVEIHDAMCNNDEEEMRDAIGDSIVTLINLSKILGFTAEEALEGAFGVIELRKGITTTRGDFVRYGKLSEDGKIWCDENQGAPDEEYFDRANLDVFTPENFKRD